MERENLPGLADKLGKLFESRARVWKERWPLVGDVRGLGAMRAIELVRSQETREPAKEETAQILRYCHEHGLILISAGSYDNVLRLLVPLVVTDDQFDEGLNVLEGALVSVAGSGFEAKPRSA